MHARQQHPTSKDGRNREDPSVPFLTHGFFDVVSGAATEFTVVFFFINLRQCGFCIRGGGTKKRNHPHPEYRTRATETDSGSNPSNVTGTHTA
ncbi:Uncharacterised protein [Vibrio cholerae]|uniref:Uncharacterized protein n=1 Tax=Vibrio cholerae TaxID=666 RepID=A0A655YNE2_VIBCL|nr:Uncharacterised protein [Vibrio cholerae]